MLELGAGLAVAGITAAVVWFLELSRSAYLLAPALGIAAAGVTRLLLPRSLNGQGQEEKAKANQPAPVDSTREVIETVVFVIVLVLLLKSFVAEAFVIPTGSMAETLWGYQKVVSCPECDFQFPVNCSGEVEPQDGRVSRVTSCVCPNCRKQIDLRDPATDTRPPDRMLSNGADTIPDPGPTSGDRVLVAKFLYDLVQRDPDRLDVVVFKFPGNSNPHDPTAQPLFPQSGPFKSNVPMNYIKRLIGLPGETIAIQGGKLYVLPPGKRPRFDDLDKAKTEAERQVLEKQLWMYDYMHSDDREAQDLFRQGKFEILRKGPDTVLAMKRIVYDNDHQARDLKNSKIPPRWSGDSWSPKGDHGFAHQGSGGDQPSWLRYHHYLRNYLRDGKAEPSLITDFMGYNSAGGLEGSGNWTRDLVLECEATIDQPQGELILELARGIDRFQARFNLADGLCRLIRITTANSQDKPEVKELASVKTPVQKGTYQLRLSDVDERLLLWVNDKLVLPDGVPFESPRDPCPKEWNDLEPAGVGVRGTSAHVEHLRLWRDTYYTTGRGEVSDFDPANPKKWSNFQHMPVRTLYVQPDHFLCMGDNSPHSADSRQWGTVPRRLLLGKALAVYYPFYFPLWPLNSQVNRIGLIH